MKTLAFCQKNVRCGPTRGPSGPQTQGPALRLIEFEDGEAEAIVQLRARVFEVGADVCEIKKPSGKWKISETTQKESPFVLAPRPRMRPPRLRLALRRLEDELFQSTTFSRVTAWLAKASVWTTLVGLRGVHWRPKPTSCTLPGLWSILRSRVFPCYSATCLTRSPSRTSRGAFAQR